MASVLKTMCVGLLLVFLLLGCSDLSSKESKIEFIREHQRELELAVDHLLSSKWTIETANRFLHQKGIVLSIVEVNKEDRVVSFFIDGMIDNCYGIAYSESGKQGQLCGGRIVNWEQLVDKWYDLISI
jgi:hypothetical protein